MPVYAVMLRGENFIIEFDGKPMRCGFYTTRYVRARSEQDAEMAAVNLVRTDEALLKCVCRETSPNPMLFAERIERRSWWKGFRSGKGFTFWDMDAESQASPSNNSLEGDACKATRASS